jgi:hypothetical protein
MNRCYFNNVDDMARFCATLLREGIAFEVQETNAAGRYVVELTGF